MAGQRLVRIIRTRAGVVISTTVVVIAAGTYVATKGFNNPDTAAPVVRIAAPADPTAGDVTLTAICKDAVGCISVTFKLDGADLGTDTTSPFTYAWSSTDATDGTHHLSATGLDAAGNTATSSRRPVNVENGRANEWINVTAGASPSRCSSPCAYDSTHAYGSFNDAAAAASAGDLALVRDGTYPAQTVTASPGGSYITIRSNNGQANVTTGILSISTSYVTLDGFTTANNDPTGDTGYGLTGIQAYDDTGANPRTENHMIFKNILTHNVYVAADDVTLQNDVVGPEHACNVIDAGGGEDGVLLSSNVPLNGSVQDFTMDNVTVHDIDRWVGGVQAHGVCSNHTDGMQVFSADGLTIENSHFYRNATSNILARPCCSGSPVLDNWVLQNDEFGATLEGGNNVLLGADAESCHGSNNFLLQNNVFAVESLRLGCSGTPAVVRSNIIANSGFETCSGIQRNATYSYNTFASGADGSCTSSSHAQSCTPTWADPTHTDGSYDISASDTCAVDKGDPVHFPALDIHGISRPLGLAPDAGANEAG